VRIEVNGKPRDLVAPATAADLLRVLELDRRSVVVEVNREIVRREQLEQVELAEGDRVELVHFVGGG
jgi:thiamine biosynthesis protein ThiS